MSNLESATGREAEVKAAINQMVDVVGDLENKVSGLRERLVYVSGSSNPKEDKLAEASTRTPLGNDLTALSARIVRATDEVNEITDCLEI